MGGDWHEELQLATDAAIAAGELLQSLAKEELTVLCETRRDIKLAADQQAEALIVERLTASGYAILAEEGGGHGDLTSGAPMWVVDPLDGTMNFSRGLPINCVSIALMEGERPLLGLIHDFNRAETFTGIASEQTWLNGTPVQVSDVDSAEDAIIALGLHADRDFDATALQNVIADMRRFRKIRMLGSAALMLAYVASGRLDAYSEDDIKLWDIAAGLALVQGAGGYISVEPSRRHQWGRRVRCASRRSVWE